MKPKDAINFALNNNIAPRLVIRDIEWVETKRQWKVKVWEYDGGFGAWSGVPYRHKIYFDEAFINLCDEFVKKGVTKWCERVS